MPDFAPNYTARIKLAYSVAGANHHMQWRAAPDIVPADVESYTDKMIAFLNTLQSAMWSDFTLIGASYALADSNIFLPATLNVGDFGGGDVSTSGRLQAAKALQTGFVGRSAAGQRAGFFLYGLTWNVIGFAFVSDFRVNNSESAPVSAATGILSETPPPLVANDGNDVTWYSYANVKYNDYWTRRLRQSG